jgi:hypothetical protein
MKEGLYLVKEILQQINETRGYMGMSSRGVGSLKKVGKK